MKSRRTKKSKGIDSAGMLIALLAGIFIILSFAFSTSAFTGNAIADMNVLDANFTGLGFFIIGIVLAISYIKGRK